MRRKKVPEQIRPTKVGIWFVLLTLLIGVAATNTGNNALYMVLALMLATLVVSGVLSRNNVKKVDVEAVAPDEIFAGTAATLQVHLKNLSRLVPRWLLLVSFSDLAPSLLCSFLPRRSTQTLLADITFSRRGRHQLKTAHLATIFPFGLFRKGTRQELDLEVLVYPRLLAGEHGISRSTAAFGATRDRNPGWGYDLHSLRDLRPGDDPRRIHWKQTARTGKMIFMELEAEKSRRVTLVIDNALDPAEGLEAQEKLETRISRGAAAALDYLSAGFEVELITRSEQLPFGGGSRQRSRILEVLALLEAALPDEEPLGGSGGVEIRFDAGALGVHT